MPQADQLWHRSPLQCPSLRTLHSVSLNVCDCCSNILTNTCNYTKYTPANFCGSLAVIQHTLQISIHVLLHCQLHFIHDMHTGNSRHMVDASPKMNDWMPTHAKMHVPGHLPRGPGATMRLTSKLTLSWGPLENHSWAASSICSDRPC